MASSLKWYDSNVKRTIRLRTSQGLTRVAMLTRRQARRNLTENNQNDTKFLRNSIYVATPDMVTPIPADGTYLSEKTGRMVKRKSGPVVQPTEGAHVGVAAEYAVYPELQNSYLYRALTQVEGRQAEQAMVGLGTGIIVGDDE
jgi:hypothetical protein